MNYIESATAGLSYGDVARIDYDEVAKNVKSDIIPLTGNTKTAYNRIVNENYISAADGEEHLKGSGSSISASGERILTLFGGKRIMNRIRRKTNRRIRRKTIRKKRRNTIRRKRR